MAEYTIINKCQICAGGTEEILSLGEIPLVDSLMEPGRTMPAAKYPTPLRYCPCCRLVQLGCIVDNKLRFPKDYPYTGGTTKILRDNFAGLAQEISGSISLGKEDLIVDIGCNDGTLLNGFKGRVRTLGITPENMGQTALRQGHEVIQAYFTDDTAGSILQLYGQAAVITATNVLAHFDDVNAAVRRIKQLLKPQGLFVSESGYLITMLESCQYDSIHHEHLRYYSLTSLKALLDRHGLDIIRAQEIGTHGGSLRVYAGHRGQHRIHPSVGNVLKQEADRDLRVMMADFRRKVLEHKNSLRHLVVSLIEKQKTVYGLGAPGRATVLLNYTGLDARMIEAVAETEGSCKIGKIIPGTGIRITAEKEFLERRPEYALVLSWHISGDLMPKLKAKGFQGDFILPLPIPVVIGNKDVP